MYVRPAGGRKLSMKALEDYCDKFYGIRFGELSRAMDVFMRAAAELMARGYRIDTPIGSFAPRLKLVREVTDVNDVKARDVKFDGVDYNPGKRWNEHLEKWTDGFQPAHNPDTQRLMADQQLMDNSLKECLTRFKGYITVGIFARQSGLTYYSARKQLEQWTKGDNPPIVAYCH